MIEVSSLWAQAGRARPAFRIAPTARTPLCKAEAAPNNGDAGKKPCQPKAWNAPVPLTNHNHATPTEPLAQSAYNADPKPNARTSKGGARYNAPKMACKPISRRRQQPQRNIPPPTS